MADFKHRNILLHAYEVENVDLNSDISDIYDVLYRRLNRDESANDRRMKLNSVSSEEDVISDFSINENGIFCVMMRISPTEEIATIPDSFFKGRTVQLGSSQSKSEPTVTVLNTVYFLVGKKYVVSSLPPSQIKRLQVYLSYLLSFEGKERIYTFTPAIVVPDGIKLNEMKEFIIGEQCHVPTSISGGKATDFRVINVAAEFLKGLANITPNIDSLIKNNILNARLLISFSKPRKMSEEDYKKILGAYIKPISDIDNVKIKLKNKKTLKGKDVLRTKSVTVERLDQIRLNERNLEYEMKEFLREIDV
ncbi:MAG: hypothetical protein HDS54_06370 [Barnesiella sp.]|nr:hypothetical protein [Barnesiella sp.]